MIELRWCDRCAAEVAFERFDCGDHGPDCLELVCTGCGVGLELAGVSAGEPAAAGPAEAREAAA